MNSENIYFEVAQKASKEALVTLELMNNIENEIKTTSNFLDQELAAFHKVLGKFHLGETGKYKLSAESAAQNEIRVEAAIKSPRFMWSDFILSFVCTWWPDSKKWESKIIFQPKRILAKVNEVYQFDTDREGFMNCLGEYRLIEDDILISTALQELTADSVKLLKQCIANTAYISTLSSTE